MNLILLKQSEIQTTSASSSSGSGDDDNTKEVETSSLFVNLSSKDERAKHITNHLHKKSGESVSIGIIDGMKGKAIVRHYHHSNNNSNSMDGGGVGSGIRLEIQSETLITPPATPEITLVLAVPFPMRIKALWPVISSFTSVTRVVIVKGE